MIDARQLYDWLKSRAGFSNWISERIAQCRLVEGADFTVERLKTRGRPRIDYLVTVDVAKHLAMMERTDRGFETRRYFIAMEKAAHEMALEMARAGMEPPAGYAPNWAYPLNPAEILTSGLARTFGGGCRYTFRCTLGAPSVPSLPRPTD